MNETPQNPTSTDQQPHDRAHQQDQAPQDQPQPDQTQQDQTQQDQTQQDRGYSGHAYRGQAYPDEGPVGYRQLRRSRTDRMLAGVCSGTADYLRIDPTLVRVGFAVLTIVSAGAAVIAYLVAWLLMPEA